MSFNIGDEYIDSREIIERVEELEGLEEACNESGEAMDPADKEELEQLLALQEQAGQYCSDWGDGVTLIRGDYFVAYCREDCGYLSKDLPWWIAIDWDKTADNMRGDYTEIEVGGYTYLVR